MKAMEMNEKKRAGWLALAVLEGLTLGAGALAGVLTRDSMGFYDTLEKPFFAPPAWVFPAVWSCLYALMALAAWFVWRAKEPGWRAALALYFAQLAVNLAWPMIFFILQALGLAFVWLALLWALTAVMIGLFLYQRIAAGVLLTPYLAWITFAGVLNFMLAQMNP